MSYLSSYLMSDPLRIFQFSKKIFKKKNVQKFSNEARREAPEAAFYRKRLLLIYSYTVSSLLLLNSCNVCIRFC